MCLEGLRTREHFTFEASCKAALWDEEWVPDPDGEPFVVAIGCFRKARHGRHNPAERSVLLPVAARSFSLRQSDNQDVPLSWAMNACCELEFYVAGLAGACDQDRATGQRLR